MAPQPQDAIERPRLHRPLLRTRGACAASDGVGRYLWGGRVVTAMARAQAARKHWGWWPGVYGCTAAERGALLASAPVEVGFFFAWPAPAMWLESCRNKATVSLVPKKINSGRGQARMA